MSYSIPDISHSPDKGFVHTRNLGQKSLDSGMYPDALWSDVVLNNVPIETTIDLLNQDWNIQGSMETNDIYETITVGDSQVDSDIRVSQTFIRHPVHYSPYEKLPKKKKYEVKPRNMEKRDRKDKYKDSTQTKDYE